MSIPIRAQTTFDYLDTESGEVCTGQIRPATRDVLRAWLAERFGGRDDVALAVEGCTGWRFVVEEMVHAGVEAHLAEPADTATQRGRKKRAKTGVLLPRTGRHGWPARPAAPAARRSSRVRGRWRRRIGSEITEA